METGQGLKRKSTPSPKLTIKRIKQEETDEDDNNDETQNILNNKVSYDLIADIVKVEDLDDDIVFSDYLDQYNMGNNNQLCWKVLLKFYEKHPYFILNLPDERKYNEQLWGEQVKVLNEITGIVKTSEYWKQSWINFKRKIMIKIFLKRFNATEKLAKFEEKFVEVFGEFKPIHDPNRDECNLSMVHLTAFFQRYPEFNGSFRHIINHKQVLWNEEVKLLNLIEGVEKTEEQWRLKWSKYKYTMRTRCQKKLECNLPLTVAEQILWKYIGQRKKKKNPENFVTKVHWRSLLNDFFKKHPEIVYTEGDAALRLWKSYADTLNDLTGLHRNGAQWMKSWVVYKRGILLRAADKNRKHTLLERRYAAFIKRTERSIRESLNSPKLIRESINENFDRIKIKSENIDDEDDDIENLESMDDEIQLYAETTKDNSVQIKIEEPQFEIASDENWDVSNIKSENIEDSCSIKDEDFDLDNENYGFELLKPNYRTLRPCWNHLLTFFEKHPNMLKIPTSEKEKMLWDKEVKILNDLQETNKSSGKWRSDWSRFKCTIRKRIIKKQNINKELSPVETRLLKILEEEEHVKMNTNKCTNHILSFYEKHPNFSIYRQCDKLLWSKQVKILNSISGKNKTESQWCKVWNQMKWDFKLNLLEKMKSNDPLSEEEKRIWRIINRKRAAPRSDATNAVSRVHWRQLEGFFKEHPEFVHNPTEYEAEWDKQRDFLNRKTGINKTGYQWMTCWINFKSGVINRVNNKNRIHTALDLRYMAIINGEKAPEGTSRAITQLDWQKLENFFHEHPEMVHCPYDDEDEWKELWDKHHDLLNSITGLNITGDQWMVCWMKFKIALTKKALIPNRRHRSLEQRYITLIGSDQGCSRYLKYINKAELNMIAWEHMTAFFEQHRDLLKLPLHKKEWRDLWNEEVKILNSIVGFKRESKHWTRSWFSCKYRARCRRAKLKDEDLTEFDKRVLALSGDEIFTREPQQEFVDESTMGIKSETGFEEEQYFDEVNREFSSKDVEEDNSIIIPSISSININMDELEPKQDSNQLNSSLLGKWKHLLVFFENHPNLVHIIPNTKLSKLLWDEEVKKLNQINGINKTSKEWRLYWVNFKSRFRKKLIAKQNMNEPLTKLENRFLRIVRMKNNSTKLTVKKYTNHLLTFFETHPNFKSQGKEEKEIWRQEVEILNSICGTTRTETQWHGIWSHLKWEIKVNLLKKIKLKIPWTDSDKRNWKIVCRKIERTSRKSARNYMTFTRWKKVENFFQDHPELVRDTSYNSKDLWNKQLNSLNNLVGLNKTVDQWMSYWNNFKSCLMKKANDPNAQPRAIERRYIALINGEEACGSVTQKEELRLIWEHMTTFFEKHRDLLKYPLNGKEWKDLWTEEVKVLNSLTNSNKEKKRWSRAWWSCKWQVRRRQAQLDEADLSDLDKRVLALCDYENLIKEEQSLVKYDEDDLSNDSIEIKSELEEENDDNISTTSIKELDSNELKEQIIEIESESEDEDLYSQYNDNNVSRLTPGKLQPCWEHLLIFFEKHPHLVHIPLTTKQNQLLWKEEVEKLNKINGTDKTPKNWRDHWRLFKRRYIRKITEKQNMKLELTEFEKKFLKVFEEGKNEEDDDDEKKLLPCWEHLLLFFEKHPHLVENPFNIKQNRLLWEEEVKILNEISDTDKSPAMWKDHWRLFKRRCIRKITEKQNNKMELTEIEKKILKIVQEKKNDDDDEKELLPCWEHLLIFFEKHPDLVENPFNIKQNRLLWEEQVKILNEISGTDRTVTMWRDRWTHFKNRCRKKIIEKQNMKMELTEFEKKYQKIVKEEKSVSKKDLLLCWQRLIQFFEKHPKMVQNPLNNKQNRLLWEEEVKILNEISDADKTPEMWREHWRVFKWKYIRKITEKQKMKLQLTEIENTFLMIVEEEKNDGDRDLLPCWRRLIEFFEKYPKMVQNPLSNKESRLLWEKEVKILNEISDSNKAPETWRDHWRLFKWRYTKKITEKQEMKTELTKCENKFLKIIEEEKNNTKKELLPCREHLIHFFEKHPNMVYNTLNTKENRLLWEEEAKILNEISGTDKTPEMWIDHWRVFRWKYKKKIMEKQNMKMELTDIENKFLMIIDEEKNDGEKELLPCWEHLIIFFEKHPNLVYNPLNTIENRLLWEEEVKILNEISDADKTPTMWRQHWCSFKWRYIKKLAEKQMMNMELLEIEKKFLKIVEEKNNDSENKILPCWERLILFIDNHPDVFYNPTLTKQNRLLWGREVKILNQISGTNRTAALWKRHWSSFKSRFTKKLKEKQDANEPLTELETKFLNLIVDDKPDGEKPLDKYNKHLLEFFEKHPDFDPCRDFESTIWLEEVKALNLICDKTKAKSSKQWLAIWMNIKWEWKKNILKKIETNMPLSDWNQRIWKIVNNTESRINPNQIEVDQDDHAQITYEEDDLIEIKSESEVEAENSSKLDYDINDSVDSHTNQNCLNTEFIIDVKSVPESDEEDNYNYPSTSKQQDDNTIYLSSDSVNDRNCEVVDDFNERQEENANSNNFPKQTRNQLLLRCWENLILFFEKHPHMIHNPCTSKDSTELWEEHCKLLNHICNTDKTPELWKKYWTIFKWKYTRKLREKQEMSKELTEIENKFLKIIDQVSQEKISDRLLTFFETHPCFDARNLDSPIWMDEVKVFNSICGKFKIKTPQQWFKTWTETKWLLKKNVLQKIKSNIPLTGLDQRILRIINNTEKKPSQQEILPYYEDLIAFFEKYPHMIHNPSINEESKLLWEEEVKILNKTYSTDKTPSLWRQHWSSFKYKFRKKLIEKQDSNEELSEFESNFLKLVGDNINLGEKLTDKYKERLLAFFVRHPDFDRHYDLESDIWLDEVKALNSLCNKYKIKTSKQWIKTWHNIKWELKKNCLQKIKLNKPLNDSDQKILTIIKNDESRSNLPQKIDWRDLEIFFQEHPELVNGTFDLWNEHLHLLNNVMGLNKTVDQWMSSWVSFKDTVMNTKNNRLKALHGRYLALITGERIDKANLGGIQFFDNNEKLMLSSWENMAAFFERCPNVLKPPRSRGKIQLWDIQVVTLNSLTGLNKTAEQWLQAWLYCKWQVKCRQAQLQELTDLDKRILALCGNGSFMKENQSMIEDDDGDVSNDSIAIKSESEFEENSSITELKNDSIDIPSTSSVLLKQENDCNMDLSTTIDIKSEEDDDEQADSYNSIEKFSELYLRTGDECNYPSSSKENNYSPTSSVNNFNEKVSNDFLQVKEESEKLGINLPQQNAGDIQSWWEHLVSFFEKYPQMVHNPLEILNKFSGTERTTENWRTCWTEFVEKFRRRITGKQNRNEQLTEFEKRFLTVVEDDLKTLMNRCTENLLEFFERRPNFDPRPDFASPIWTYQVVVLNALSVESKTASEWFKTWLTFKCECKRILSEKLKSKIPLSDLDRRVWKIVRNSEGKTTRVVSKDHWKKLADFFQEHPELIHSSSEESKHLWEKQLNLLNSTTGLKQTAEQWMKCWNSFKVRFMNAEKPLSLLEQKYQAIINSGKGVDDQLRKEIETAIELDEGNDSNIQSTSSVNEQQTNSVDSVTPAEQGEEIDHESDNCSSDDDYIPSDEEKEKQEDVAFESQEIRSSKFPCWKHLLQFFEKHPHMAHNPLNNKSNKLLWEKEVKILNKISSCSRTPRCWRNAWSGFQRRFHKNLTQKQNRNEPLTDFEKKFLKIVVVEKENDVDRLLDKYREHLLAFFEKHPDFDTRKYSLNYYWAQEVNALNAICNKHKKKTSAQWLKMWSHIKWDFKRSYLFKIKSNMPLTESDERIWRIIKNSEKKTDKSATFNAIRPVQWRQLEIFFQEHPELIHNHSEGCRHLWKEHQDTLNNIAGVKSFQWMHRWKTFKARVIRRSKDPNAKLQAVERRYLALINGEQVSGGLQFFDNKEELMMLSWEHMTKFFEQNPILLKFRQSRKGLRMWDEEVEILNNLTGLNKTAGQWIRAWSECKWQAKRRRDQLGESDLTDLEKRILALCDVNSLTKEAEEEEQTNIPSDDDDDVSNESIEIKSDPELEEDNSFNNLNTKINDSSKVYFLNKIENNPTTIDDKDFDPLKEENVSTTNETLINAEYEEDNTKIDDFPNNPSAIENDLSTVSPVKQENEIDVSDILIDGEHNELDLTKKRKFSLSEPDNDPSTSNYLEQNELSNSSINQLNWNIVDDSNQLEENENLDIELYIHTKKDSLTCWEHLLTFFEKHPNMVDSPLNSKQNLSLWEEEVKVLNEINDSNKSCEQWTRLWTIFKPKCKKQIGEKQFRREQLTEFEKRFLTIIESGKNSESISCWEHLLLFFEKHPDLTHFIPPDAESKLLWADEVKILNEITDSDRTPQQWRRQWCSFKSKTRTMITEKQKFNLALSNLELKFLKVVGDEKIDSKTITNKCAEHLLNFFEKHPKFDFRRHAGSALWLDEVETLNFICKNFRKKTSQQWLKTWSQLKWELKRELLRKIKLNIPFSDSDRRNWKIIFKKRMESINTPVIFSSASEVHWEKLEIFFEMHPELVKDTGDKSAYLWFKHINTLNNITGLDKTALEWMSCWKNFKSKILLKEVKASTPLEQRYLAMIINGEKVEDKLIGGLEFFDNKEELKMKSWEHFATFFEQNPKMLTKLEMDMWQKQAKALNALTGLNKDVKDWIRVWMSCKLEVKQRRLELNELTDLDKRILALCEVDTVINRKDIDPEEQTTSIKIDETDDISNESIEIKTELEDGDAKEENTFSDLEKKIEKSSTVYFSNKRKLSADDNLEIEPSNFLLNDLGSTSNNSVPSFVLKYNDTTDSYNIEYVISTEQHPSTETGNSNNTKMSNKKIKVKSEPDDESIFISTEQQPSTSLEKIETTDSYNKELSNKDEVIEVKSESDDESFFISTEQQPLTGLEKIETTDSYNKELSNKDEVIEVKSESDDDSIFISIEYQPSTCLENNETIVELIKVKSESQDESVLIGKEQQPSTSLEKIETTDSNENEVIEVKSESEDESVFISIEQQPPTCLENNETIELSNKNELIEVKSEAVFISKEQQPSTSSENNWQAGLHETVQENELIDTGLAEHSSQQFCFWENILRYFLNPEFTVYGRIYDDPEFRTILQQSGVNYNEEEWNISWLNYRTALKDKVEKTPNKLTDLEVRFAEMLKYKRRNIIIKEEIKMEIKEERIEIQPQLKEKKKKKTEQLVKKKTNSLASDSKFGLKFRSVLKQRFQTVIESGIVNDKKYEICWKNLLIFLKKHPKFILPLSLSAEEQNLWNSKIEYLNHISGLKKTEQQWKDTLNLYKTCLRQKEKDKILTPIQMEYIELLDRAEEEILFTPNYEIYWQHLLSFYESNPKLIYNDKVMDNQDEWMEEVAILNSLSGLKRNQNDWRNVWMIFKNYIKRKSEDPDKHLSCLERQFLDLLEREKNHDVFNNNNIMCWKNLLSFLEKYPHFIDGTMKESDKILWSEQVQVLNKIGGFEKSDEDWRTNWLNYKDYLLNNKQKLTNLQRKFLDLIENSRKCNSIWEKILEFSTKYPNFKQQCWHRYDPLWNELVKTICNESNPETVAEYQKMWFDYKSNLQSKVHNILQTKGYAHLQFELCDLDYRICKMLKSRCDSMIPLEYLNEKERSLRQGRRQSKMKRYDYILNFVLKHPELAKNGVDKLISDPLWTQLLRETTSISSINTEELKKIKKSWRRNKSWIFEKVKTGKGLSNLEEQIIALLRTVNK